MVLALEVLRGCRSKKVEALDSTVERARFVLNAGDRASRMVAASTFGAVRDPLRLLRARLALLLRAMLRANAGDCGRARCSGCRCRTRSQTVIASGFCGCCERSAEWHRDRITPLWERAPKAGT
jgi:hypothetical protein